MNILINCDSKFKELTACLMISVQKNNDCKITFIYSSFESDDRNDVFTYLKKYVNRQNNIFYLRVPFFPFAKTKKGSRWTNDVFLKMIVPYYLPSSIKHFLYLDSDIIVNDNIESEYNYCVSSNKAILGQNETYINSLEAIDIMPIHDNMYFNGGCLFINVTKYLQIYPSISAMKKAMKRTSYDCPFNEQDMLNYLFDQEKEPFPKSLNMIMCWEFKRTKFKIYHYAGSERPWNTSSTGMNYRMIFWKYGFKVLPFTIYLKSFISFHKVLIKRFFYQ